MNTVSIVMEYWRADRAEWQPWRSIPLSDSLPPMDRLRDALESDYKYALKTWGSARIVERRISDVELQGDLFPDLPNPQ